MIAYTSKGAFDYLRAKDSEVKQIRDRLRASSSDEILGKIEKMTSTEKELRKKIEQLESKSAGGEVDELLAKAQTLAGMRIVIAPCTPDAQGIKRLRDLSDMIKQKAPEAIIILGMKDPEGARASLLVAVGPKATSIVNAQEVIQNIASFIDGRGGGKSDLAQAGGSKPAGLDAALEHAKEWIDKKLRV